LVNDKLPFTAHLEELRRRLIICCIGIGIGFLGSFFFAKKIFYILMLPLTRFLPPKSTMIYTALPEAFFTYLKLSFFSGIFFAAPLILYEIWCFIAPGLYDHEKKYLFPFVTLSTIFFIGGVLFAYFVIFPIAFRFFLGYASDNITPLPSIKEYLSFSCKLLLAFGVVFELPLFSLFLAKIGLINASLLKRNRKYALVLIFVVAAIFTPPDVVSQLLMAFPLIFLYELSIVLTKIFAKKS